MEGNAESSGSSFIQKILSSVTPTDLRVFLYAVHTCSTRRVQARIQRWRKVARCRCRRGLNPLHSSPARINGEIEKEIKGKRILQKEHICI